MPSQAKLVSPAPIPTAAPIVSILPVGGTVLPVSNQVGMYSGPGYEYTPLSTLNRTTVLTIVQVVGSWYNVHVGATYGWVSAGLVRAVGTPQVPKQQNQVQTYSRASATTRTVASTWLYVVVGPLNIRSGPGKSHKITGFVLPGTRLAVLSTTPHWAYVVTPTGVTCWVDMHYLSSTPPVKHNTQTAVASHGTSQQSPAAQGPATARVTVPALNVRAAPSERAQIITVLFADEIVQVISRTEDWIQIKLHNGDIGWVSAAYLANN
jgi:N-acetylmuramoyl-L-alanine amidase